MSRTSPDHPFAALSAAEARTAALMARPQILVIGAIAILASAGWTLLALHAAGAGARDGFAALGPGMALFDRWALPHGLADICRALVANGTVAQSPFAPASFAVTFAMWAAMALAMMLPSAAPMLLTYIEIAQTAAEKGKKIVSVFVLGAGYLVIWLGFSLMAAGAQSALAGYGLVGDGGASLSLGLSAAALLIAGLYQFSPLKDACLTKCRRPFTFFFANWTGRPAGIFRLGLRQGLFCLGCCWALMLVMFSVGLANLIWMALIASVMIAEKVVARPRPLRLAIGATLGFAGTTLLAVEGFGIWR